MATTSRGEAERLAAQLPLAAYERLVIAGGDGTINEAVNGLRRNPAGSRTLPVGILPLGTANVLAREIGLEVSPEAIVRCLLNGSVRSIALGAANDRCFLLMAGVGFDARVVAGVNLALKRQIGKCAYVIEACRQLWRNDFPVHEIDIDGRRRTVASVLAAKGRHYGGGFVAAPRASLETPAFQVLLLPGAARRDMVRYGIALALGRISRLSDVELCSAVELTISGPAGEPVQADGDVIGTVPMRLAILPAALRLLYPPAVGSTERSSAG